MNIELRRIDKTRFDELMEKLLKEFEENGSLSIDDKLIESYSVPVTVNGHIAEMYLDIDKYQAIADEEIFGYTKLAKVGMALHDDFKYTSVTIPRNVFYEKEFWAYLSLTHFKDVVKGLRASLKEGQISADKIKQFYFNVGTLSRTGLLFIWVMIDRLNSADNFDVSHTAFEFVDPVKAILERTMSKNPMILRAFVQGIINNGKDAKFKSKAFKSKMPSHISCYASVSVLDALEYDELVEVIAEQQKAIISE